MGDDGFVSKIKHNSKTLNLREQKIGWTYRTGQLGTYELNRSVQNQGDDLLLI